MQIVQTTTLVLSIIIMALFALAVHRRYISWRYMVLPSLVMVAIAAFYTKVLFFGGFGGSEANAMWSAALRLYTLLVVASMSALWIYYHKD